MLPLLLYFYRTPTLSPGVFLANVDVQTNYVFMKTKKNHTMYMVNASSPYFKVIIRIFIKTISLQHWKLPINYKCCIINYCELVKST